MVNVIDILQLAVLHLQSGPKIIVISGVEAENGSVHQQDVGIHRHSICNDAATPPES